MPSKQALDAAVSAAADGVGKSSPNLLTLGTGVVLRVKPVSPLLIRRAAASIPEPEVPQLFLEDKGREEANPDDPEYKRALQKYSEEVEEASTLLMLAAGTEVVEVPEEMESPEGETWLSQVEEIMSFTGAEFDPKRDRLDTRIGRYLVWLQYYAIRSLQDLVKLLSTLAELSGVSEEAVAKAVSSFRGGTLGRAVDGLPAEDAGDGDNV